MRQFIKRLLIFFVFPALAICSIFEIGVRSIPNNYSYQSRYLARHAHEIQTLILGGSNGFYSIVPEKVDGFAFNAAAVSQTFKYDLFILKKYLPRMNNLKFVVLPVSPCSFYYRLEDVEPYRIKNYCIYYECNYYPMSLKKHFEILNEKPFEIVKRIIKYHLTGDYGHLTYRSSGFGTACSKSAKSRDDLDESGIIRAQTHSFINDSTNIDENKAFFDTIINLCSRHKIGILIVTPPVWPTYLNHISKRQTSRIISICENAAKDDCNIRYINYLTDKRLLSVEYFHDGDHLSEIGAVKMTGYLNDSIRAYATMRKIL